MTNIFVNSSEHRKGVLMILLAAILWSTGGLCIKWTNLDALQVSALRSIFTVITFWIIFKNKVFKFSVFTFINGIFYAGILVLFVIATKKTTAANAIFLQYTAPIYVLIFEPLILKTKYKLLNVLTIIFCFIGMTLFFVGKLSPGDYEGNLIAILSGIAFAAFLIGMRKNKNSHQEASIFWGNVLIVLLFGSTLIGSPAVNTREIMIGAYLGIFQIGIAYAVFTYGLKRVEAIEASLISMIEPVLNPVWVFIGKGEVPTLFAIVGGVLILITITIRTYLVERRRFI